MTDREYRLRERIDTLTDQLDQALERVGVLEVRLKKAHRKTSDARRSRELWRHRACNAKCVRRKAVA